MKTKEQVYPINVWINEERYQRLQQANLANLAKDVLAGLKVLQVPVTAGQKDILLKKFPTAKCDTATTKTIELLPRAAKDRLFDLMVEKQKVEVMEDFLKSL